MKRASVMALLVLAALSGLSPSVAPLGAQSTGTARVGGGARGRAPRGWRGQMDSTRARELYVSDDPKDLAGCGPNDCAAQTQARLRDDSIFTARSRGILTFEKIHYRSRADGLEIPAELFGPLEKSGQPHAALVW